MEKSTLTKIRMQVRKIIIRLNQTDFMVFFLTKNIKQKKIVLSYKK